MKKRHILYGVLIIICIFLFVYIFTDSEKITSFACGILGGEVRSEVQSVGIGIVYEKACYSRLTTSDAGKKCESDRDCEGDCRVEGGDFVINDYDSSTANYSSTCNSFKTILHFFPRRTGYNPDQL